LLTFTRDTVDIKAMQEKYENLTCWPLKYAIYEGADGPLETAPDRELKSMNVVDFVMAGRPGMVTGAVGKKE